MFGLSGTELAFILVLALLLLGPAKLPSLAQRLGNTMRELNRAVNGVRDRVEGELQQLEENARPEQQRSPPPALESTVESRNDPGAAA